MKVLMHRIVLLGGIGLLVMAAGTACTLSGADAAPMLTPGGGSDLTFTEEPGLLLTPSDIGGSSDVFADMTATAMAGPFAMPPATSEEPFGEAPIGIEETPIGGEPVLPGTEPTSEPGLIMTPVEPIATVTPFEPAPVVEATATPMAPPASADAGCPSTYTVQSGDTLFRIALRFGLTVQDLASANGITNPDSLPIGTVLSIPGCGSAASSSGTGATTSTGGDIQHVVQAGENLFRIALQYGLSWERVAAYNGITNPNNISVGQVILIPQN